MSPSCFRVVQISDTHLFAEASHEFFGISTTASLQAVIASIRQLQPQPDLILMTGDLSQDETARSYQVLQDLIAPLGIATYWLPGNHDHLPLMEQTLSIAPISTQKVFQHQGWNFILLNSMSPGQVHGVLSEQALANLDQTLQQLPQQPTLISLHHPDRKSVV